MRIVLPWRIPLRWLGWALLIIVAAAEATIYMAWLNHPAPKLQCACERMEGSCRCGMMKK
jgi:hypothetical protein